MTHTGPHGNHKKKVPYEGCTLESDKARKMRTALLETCMGPQTQCKTILLLQNVFFKMSESEHSDLEFYIFRVMLGFAWS